MAARHFQNGNCHIIGRRCIYILDITVLHLVVLKDPADVFCRRNELAKKLAKNFQLDLQNGTLDM